ncbi:MAG: hypothetical protein ACRDFX_03070, partial [Chloroflexota bacterium]
YSTVSAFHDFEHARGCVHETPTLTLDCPGGIGGKRSGFASPVQTLPRHLRPARASDWMIVVQPLPWPEYSPHVGTDHRVRPR